MEPADSIQRLGFRRWYERQLYESFAWLTTCLLCGAAFAAVFEFIGFKGGGAWPMLTLLVLYVVGMLGLTAWRASRQSLTRAQDYAGRATCSRCSAYGLFDVKAAASRVGVQCRKCGNEWPLGPPAAPGRSD